MTKTVQNLIILDKSGSMSTIRKQAVAGVVETIRTIQVQQKAHPEMEQRITLLTFCSCNSTYVYNNVPAGQASVEAMNAYSPCCGTPLYDAIGDSCISLAKLVAGAKDTAVSVTIITDGYENSSSKWTGGAVNALIEQYKAQGWLFAYIGADHDVEAVCAELGIDNSMAFDKTQEGTSRMFERECKARMRWTARLCDAIAPIFCNEDYFDDEDK